MALKWYDPILFGLFIGMGADLLLARCAKAEEFSEIDPNSAAYCALYSREVVRIRIMHPNVPLVADTDIIGNWALEEYTACISILPYRLPVPKSANYEGWLADMRDLIILNAGTIPAAEEPVSRSLDDEEWRAQCRAEYHTWEEETGTVVRRGNPERVRCPCGGEVTCGE